MVKFVNPFNFIPRGKEISAASAEDAHDLNGVIVYELLTKTPLFIPNTSNEKAFSQKDESEKHKSYDFFSYNDLSQAQNLSEKHFAPVIPGSEMRGLLRSNYEILTNSCMSSLNKETLLSKRTTTSFEAGLLQRLPDGVFKLYKAEDVLWRTKGANNPKTELNWDEIAYYDRQCYIQDVFPEGCKVSFDKISRGKFKALADNVQKYGIPGSSGRDTGYLIKGMPGPVMKPNKKGKTSQKHCAHIFSPKPEMVADFDKAAMTELLKSLRIILDIYQENAKPGKSYVEYKGEYTQFLLGKGEEYFPVYYSKIEDGAKTRYYLSPACKTRELYKINLQKLGKDLSPCDSIGKLCEACSLFGTLVNGAGQASRLRVTDLHMPEKPDYADCYHAPITLKPLSTPRPSNVEFYLKRPDGAIFWTYEYYVDGKHQVHICDGELAGRKFYWHNVSHFNLDDCRAAQRKDLNSTVRPLKARNRFIGKVYFDGLSEKELKKLIYVINAGDFGDIEHKNHGYKLGTAKPLGFGSVACEVKEVKLRKYDIESETVQCNNPDVLSKYGSEENYGSLFDATIRNNFEKMTGFDSINKELESGCRYSYPKLTEDGDIFQWFQENHQGWSYNKEKGQEIITKLPNKREDQCILAFMQPMQPVLRRNEKITTR